MNPHFQVYDMLSKNTETLKYNSDYLSNFENLINRQQPKEIFDNYKSEYNMFDSFLNNSISNSSIFKEHFSTYLMTMREIRLVHVLTHEDENTDRDLQFSTEMIKSKEILFQLIIPILIKLKSLNKSYFDEKCENNYQFQIISFAVYSLFNLIISLILIFFLSKKINDTLSNGLVVLDIIPKSLKSYLIENIIDIKKKELDDE